MSTPSLRWIAASTLDERLAAGPPPSRLAAPSARAVRRMERWAGQRPFQDGRWYQRRLASDALDEATLLRLLDEPATELATRIGAPGFSEALTAVVGGGCDVDLTQMVGASEQAPTGFLHLVAPFLARAGAGLRGALAEIAASHPSLPFSLAPIEAERTGDLARDLLAMVTPTLALELRVAALQGRLTGSTPAERYAAFVDLLRDPAFVQAIFDEYPVLARQLLTQVDAWTSATTEFASRLAADWPQIAVDLRAPAGVGALERVAGGAGDGHRGGRRVLAVTWSSGFCVHYKPRAVAVDARFQEVIAWANARGLPLPLRTHTFLARDGYGWVEHVAAGPCADPEGISRFYGRLGESLALLHALEATDLHCENVVAAGEQPVLVDLEALFHRSVDRDPADAPGGADLFTDVRSDAAGYRALGESVLGVGLLPLPELPGRDGAAFDLSGLGAPEVQLTPYTVPTWEGVGTDQIRCVRKRVPFKALHHRPSMGGVPADPSEHERSLMHGFVEAYRLLLRHRAEFTAPGGPLDRFAGDEVRVLARSTAVYALLLQETMHPDALRDALDRERHFDRLWFGVESRPDLAELIRFERADLWRGDIPMFTTRPASRDLVASDGHVLVDYFAETSLDRVRARLAAWGDDDLERQVWFIRASLAMRRPHGMDAIRPATSPPTHSRLAVPAVIRSGPPPIRTPRPRVATDCRALAFDVGERLERTCLRDRDGASWIGLTVEGGLAPVGADLGEGAAGIALFLAYLAHVTGEARFRTLAEQTWGHTLRACARPATAPVEIGAFQGWTGVAWTMVHLAALWDEPSWCARAEQLLDRVAERVPQDRCFDVMGGAAGCVGGLVAMYRATGSARALAVAQAAAAHLVANAQPMAHGRGWIPYFERRALSGFAHGAAGCAWALTELWAVDHDDRWLALACEAVTYEDTLVVPAEDNWLDLRKQADGSLGPATCMCAWCHGAAGIGLARARMRGHVREPGLRARLQADVAAARRAVQSGQSAHAPSNDCLCHGALGNLELLAITRTDRARPVRNGYATYAQHIAARIGRFGPRSGLPGGIEAPGLLSGLAGIGFGLLRIAAPDVVPSVLLLDPPFPAVGGAR